MICDRPNKHRLIDAKGIKQQYFYDFEKISEPTREIQSQIFISTLFELSSKVFRRHFKVESACKREDTLLSSQRLLLNAVAQP